MLGHATIPTFPVFAITANRPLPFVRQGQTLTSEQLHAKAREAADKAAKAGTNRTALAKELGVSLPTLSRALSGPSTKLAALQRAVILHVEGFPITEKSRLYEVGARKGEA